MNHLFLLTSTHKANNFNHLLSITHRNIVLDVSWCLGWQGPRLRLRLSGGFAFLACGASCLRYSAALHHARRFRMNHNYIRTSLSISAAADALPKRVGSVAWREIDIFKEKERPAPIERMKLDIS